MQADQNLDLKKLVEVDRIIHEPARTIIMAVLYGVETADFKFLLNMTNLSKGNLSIQTRKLQEVAYLTIDKSFKNNYPHTEYRLTKKGRVAFKAYMEKLKWLSKAFEE